MNRIAIALLVISHYVYIGNVYAGDFNIPAQRDDYEMNVDQKRNINTPLVITISAVAGFFFGQSLIRVAHQERSEARYLHALAYTTYWYPHGGSVRENSPGPIYRARLAQAGHLQDSADRKRNTGKVVTVFSACAFTFGAFGVISEVGNERVIFKKRIRFGNGTVAIQRNVKGWLD